MAASLRLRGEEEGRLPQQGPGLVLGESGEEGSLVVPRPQDEGVEGPGPKIIGVQEGLHRRRQRIVRCGKAQEDKLVVAGAEVLFLAHLHHVAPQGLCQQGGRLGHGVPLGLGGIGDQKGAVLGFGGCRLLALRRGLGLAAGGQAHSRRQGQQEGKDASSHGSGPPLRLRPGPARPARSPRHPGPRGRRTAGLPASPRCRPGPPEAGRSLPGRSWRRCRRGSPSCR